MEQNKRKNLAPPRPNNRARRLAKKKAAADPNKLPRQQQRGVKPTNNRTDQQAPVVVQPKQTVKKNRAASIPKPIPKEQKIPEPALKKIKKEDLNVKDINFRLSDHEPFQVSSYSIDYSEEPYLTAPATPGVYVEPQVPFCLTKIKGPGHPDYSHKFFAYPFEAMLIALHQTVANFSIANYDFMTDRSSLRSLFEWAMGSKREIKIDLELYNNCLLMRRPEFKMNPNKSVGTSFENHCTNRFESTSEYFISEFQFGSKRVLMRYEVDCVLKEDLVLKKHNGSNVPFRNRSPGPNLTRKVVELKACTGIPGGSVRSSIWFQSYIAGVKEIVIGKKISKDHNIVISEIYRRNTEAYLENPKFAEQGIRKVIALLEFIHNNMLSEDNEHKRISLCSYKSEPGVLSLVSRQNEQPFVPPHYPFTSIA